MEEDPFTVLRYVDASTGFGFNPPEGWIKNSSLSVYDSLIVFEPPSGTIPPPQLLLMVGERIGLFSKNLEIMAKKWIKYETGGKDSKLLSETSRSINGMNAYEFIHTFTEQSQPMKCKTIGIEKNRKVLHFSYIGTLDVYEKYLPAIERSLNSVVIR
jgi:hypothetical protein